MRISIKYVGVDIEGVRMLQFFGVCFSEFDDVFLIFRLDGDLQLIGGGVGRYVVQFRRLDEGLRGLECYSEFNM